MLAVAAAILVGQFDKKIFQCPTDPSQDTFDVYDSNFTNPIATVAHANYVGCNGWVECFNNAGGNYQGGIGNDGFQWNLKCADRAARRGHQKAFKERQEGQEQAVREFRVSGSEF